MGTQISNVTSCAISAVIDAIIPDNYHYTDNSSACVVLDRMLQYLNSNKGISVEGAIMLLNKLSLIYRGAISYAAFNRTGIQTKNRSGIDAYYQEFAHKCEFCVGGDYPENLLYERDQISKYQSNDAEAEYKQNKLEEYAQAVINVYNLRNAFMEYPFSNIHNRSILSRNNVNYGD